MAVIFKDNPRVNVTIDPKRKRPSPLEKRLSLSYRHGIRYGEQLGTSRADFIDVLLNSSPAFPPAL